MKHSLLIVGIMIFVVLLYTAYITTVTTLISNRINQPDTVLADSCAYYKTHYASGTLIDYELLDSINKQ